jgi:hypothetical protein
MKFGFTPEAEILNARLAMLGSLLDRLFLVCGDLITPL